MKAWLAQLRAELQLVARNGEQLLLTLGIPVMLLVFFSLVHVLPKGTAPHQVDFLAPGVLALAVMSTSMVSLGIGTGFERTYKVLKRLGATPLGRPRLLAAKIAAVVAVELAQFAVLIPVSYALGWRPASPQWVTGAGAVILGTVAFAGIGLTFAGVLRGEVNLGALNGLYLVLLLLGGMVIPFSDLPRVLRAIARLAPSGALSETLRHALAGGGHHLVLAWVMLAIWAVVTPVVASRLFRWE
jgi:ABC-2 type transport system permease protein